MAYTVTGTTPMHIGGPSDGPMHPQGAWVVEVDQGGRIRLHHNSGLTITEAAPAIETANGHVVPDPTWESVWMRDAAFRVAYTKVSSWRVCLEFDSAGAGDWLVLRSTVSNLSKEPVPIKTITPFATLSRQSSLPFDRRLRNGFDLCDLTTLHQGEGALTSHGCAAFTNSRGDQALAVGFRDLGQSRCHVEFEATPALVTSLRAAVDREGIVVEPDETLELPAVVFGAGASMSALMQQYAALVAAENGSRVSAVPTGWCSWYYYYGTETEDDILADMRTLAASPLGRQLQVIQIDDGWNLPHPTHPRVWGDWTPGAKFPHGMKALADNIKEAGFVPGLWLAPFSVESASTLYKEHPDWLLQDTDGPVEQWGVYALDLSHPEVLEFLRDTFHRVFHEWGFDYVKLDFLVHAMGRARRHNPKLTSVQAFRKAMQVICDAAGGDRFILNCGAPIGPSVGLCDGMRIGYDVSSRWHLPMNPDGWPEGNCAIRPAAVHTIWRQWMHQAWWCNDPDCLLVRDYGSEPEKEIFREIAGGAFAEEPPYGLSEEEAACWVRLVWLTGTMALISEKLDELSEKHLRLLEQAFPLNPEPARWVDWYVDPEVSVLASRPAKPIVGVFNLSDETREVVLPRYKLGLDGPCRFRERLSGETFEAGDEVIAFPLLPAHGGRLWEVL